MSQRYEQGENAGRVRARAAEVGIASTYAVEGEILFCILVNECVLKISVNFNHFATFWYCGHI